MQSKATSLSTPKQRRSHAIVQFILGLLLFAGLLYWLGIEEIDRLRTLHLLPLLGGFAATLLITMSIGLRWSRLVTALAGQSVLSWHDGQRYFLWNRLLGFLLPKDMIDIAGRAVVLQQKHDVPLRLATTSVLIDRVFDGVIALLLLGPALLSLFGQLAISHAFWGMAGLVLLGHFLLQANVLPRFLHQYNKQVPTRYQLQQAQLLFDLPWSKLYWLSIIKYAAITFRFYCVSLALDLPIAPSTFAIGTPIVQFSLLFAVTPGSLGIFEASWAGILIQTDVGTNFIAPFLITQRILTLAFVVLLTIMVEFASRFNVSKRIFPTPLSSMEKKS